MRHLVFALGAAVLAIAPAKAQNAAEGEKVFAQCRACHQVGPTAKNGVGPVLNGLFVLIVYRSLRVLGATALSAGVFAACSAVTFYAVTGTPFMVQDSCFFLALSLLLMLESAHARGNV